MKVTSTDYMKQWKENILYSFRIKGFFREIKIFFVGAPFHVTTVRSPMSSPDSALGDPPSFSSDSLGIETPKLFNCKLTTDQRYLAFNRLDENEDESLEPLEVGKILTMEPVIGKQKNSFT